MLLKDKALRCYVDFGILRYVFVNKKKKTGIIVNSEMLEALKI